ncbi:MAG: hypothetical protein NW226_09695 [Microscillaceae bacterium]|nr:hypothetical protein [Microscillaceae bacterium]
MSILNFIQEYTHTTTYKSFKYSFESYNIPQLNYDDKPNMVFKENGEDNPPKTIKDIRPEAKLRETIPLFKYFLDGSRRTYKVDDVAVNNKIYPILAGQIGVAVCERENPSHFQKLELENQLVLVLPKILNDKGKGTEELYFNKFNEELNQKAFLKKHNIQFSKTLFYDSESIGKDQDESDKYQKRGIAKIQDTMVGLEKKLVERLCKKGSLSENEPDKGYLIKDGSLEYSQQGVEKGYQLANLISNYRKVVGVSKSFNIENLKDKNQKSLAVSISQLPIGHRTPAYKYHHDTIGKVNFTVWFIRIRELKYSESPFAGVIKVEKIITDDNHVIGTDEVDMISANLFNERNPVCYGTDTRWANHLYPIFLTETFIKSNYLSNEYFLHLF